LALSLTFKDGGMCKCLIAARYAGVFLSSGINSCSDIGVSDLGRFGAFLVRTVCLRNMFLLSLLTIFSSQCLAQTVNYHLHKETSTTTGLDQLTTASPDAASVALLSGELKGVATGEYLVQAFDTQAADPGASGTIPSGSTVTFTLFMRKTASLGTMTPRAKLFLNSTSGTQFCIATGTTALNTTVTSVSLSCRTTATITVASSDRFYLWVGVNLTAGSSSSTFKGELDIEGTANGNFDSLVGIPVPAATLTSLAPSTGAVGASITIAGKNFGSTKSQSIVTFNSAKIAIPTSWSSTQIITPVPTGATTGSLTVTVGSKASNALSFTVVPAPAVTSVSPVSGAAGSPITIAGSNFGSTTPSVKFNGTAASVNSFTTTSISTNVPLGATSGSVVVSVSGASSNGIAFTVPTPSVSGISPASGASQTPFTISGTNFGSITGTVTLNGQVATVSSWTNTAISAVVPNNASTGNVVVTTGSLSSNGTVFTVAPVVTGLAPTSGEPGATVTIAGNNFTATAGSVSFNGKLASVNNWSNTSISAQVPSGATTGNAIVTAGTLQSNGQIFTVLGPTITSLTPASGAPASSVRITGTGFGSATGTVTFNGQTAVIGTWSDTSITVTVPNGATTGNVVVSNGGLQSGGAVFTVSPFIASISPTSGEPGSSITIAGLNFTATAGTVTFNGLTATIDNWSNTSVSARAPNGATSGNIVVTSGTLQSNGQAFSVIGPAITSLTPSSGAPGISVTVVGTGFGSTTGTVTFNGQAAVIGTWSDSSITVTVPNGATTGNVVVSNGGLQSGGAAFTVSPVITSVSPTSAEPGSSITIAGLNFTATTGAVTFNGLPASITTWSSNSISAQVPNVATSGNIVVTAGTLQSNGQAFSVIGPAITSLTPSSGAPGISATVAGTGFGSATGTVTFNGQSAVVSTWSDTSITVTVPIGATTGNVVVSNGGLQSGGTGFTVAPVITSVAPVSAEPGSSITIAGSNFTATTGAVTFNGLSSVINSWANTSINVQVPNGVTSGNIVVTAGTLQSNGQPFTVLGPAITSLSPSSGAPGIPVTIVGTSFGSNTGTVTFGGQVAVVGTWSDTSIVVTVPSGAATGNVVVANGGLQSNPLTFSIASATPIVTSIVPSSGRPGTIVTISGSNFGPSNNSVAFNGQSATISTWSDTSIVVVVPLSVATGNVVVTAPGGQSNAVNFSVVPLVTSVSPVSGFPGAPVTIAGSNFGATPGQVQIGQLPMTITSWTDTSVTATVPADAINGNIVLTTNDLSPSNASSFTVDHGGPLLQLSISDAPLQVNLSSPQVLDWIHWGRISATVPDRKNGVTPSISDYSAFNGAQPNASTGNIGFSWSDGNHPASVSEATEDVETFSTASGFQITVPADTSAKTLNLYTEVFQGQAVLHATLSDGSAVAINDQSVTDLDIGSKLYSIDFRAASAGQTLTVTFSSSAISAGGVGFQAATLMPHLPAVSIVTPATGQMFPVNQAIPVSVSAGQFDSSITDIKATASDGTVLENSVSPLNANWEPLAAGHYSVAATATDNTGLIGSSTPVEFDVIGQGGTLSIDEVPPSSPIDLDGQGSADWVLWGPSNTGSTPGNILARKSGVAPLITDYKAIGNHVINSFLFAQNLCFTGDQTSYCSGSEVTVHGQGNGFEITVAADTTARTLQLYVARLSADGLVTAFLSDGSAPVATEIGGAGPPESSTTLYTINYSAASAGQMLTVRFALNSDQGNGQISLIGAALNGPSLAPLAPAPLIASISPNPSPVNTKVTISGSNFGTVQGASGVYFGGVSAQVLNWSDTSIDVSVPSALSDGSSSQVTVIAVNGTSNSVSFQVPAFQIYPPSLSIVVGQSTTVTPKDSNHNIVSGLNWFTTDPSIVSVSSDDPALITGLAPGTATVYAGDVPFQVTVYAGTTLPPGTPLWSIPLSPGARSITSVVPAVPSDSGVDVLVADDMLNLSAYSSSGELIWRQPVPLCAGNFIVPCNASGIFPDFSGNVFVSHISDIFVTTKVDNSVSPPKTLSFSHLTHTVSKLNNQTGQLTDFYTYQGVDEGNGNYGDSPSTRSIPSPSGVLFVQDLPRITVFDIATAQPIATVDLERSTFANGAPDQDPASGPMIVAGDENAYVPYIYTTQTGTLGPCTVWSAQQSPPVPPEQRSVTTVIPLPHIVDNVMVLRVSLDGSFAKIPVKTFTQDETCENDDPGPPYPSSPFRISGTGFGPASPFAGPPPFNLSVITNADQGVALIWPQPNNPPVMSLISNDVAGAPINIPLTFQPTLQREDGSYIGTNLDALTVVALDGTPVWSTKVDPDANGNGTIVHPLYATADGGAIVTSATRTQYGITEPGNLYTVDQNGNTTGQQPDTGAALSWTGSWYGGESTGLPVSNNSNSISNSFTPASFDLGLTSAGLIKYALSSVDLALSFWPEIDGNLSRTHNPPTLLMTHIYPDPGKTELTSDQIETLTRLAAPLNPKTDLPVTHTFLMADKVTSQSFVQAIEETSQATAYIGDAQLAQVILPNGPTGVLPIGLLMGVNRNVHGVFERVVLSMAPYDPPPLGLEYLTRDSLNQVESPPQLFDEQGPMQPRANVIFLGACGAYSLPYQYWFSIHSTTKNHVLIVPADELFTGDLVSVPAGVASREWMLIAQGLAKGQTVAAALAAANQQIHKPGQFNVVVPSSFNWVAIGDANLKLRPTTK
jgi:hypothetical protein